jgi:hypothetical protein
VADLEDDIEAIAEAVRNDEDGFTPPDELTAEPSPLSAQNLAAQIAQMTMGQKLKLALRGNREARAILMRDTSTMVQRFLIENPRLTDDEIVSIAKSRTIVSEILARIAKNREWSTIYLVRLALVQNPRTPLPMSLTMVPTLQDRDLRLLAKSKSIPGAVAAAARRLMITRSL